MSRKEPERFRIEKTLKSRENYDIEPLQVFIWGFSTFIFGAEMSLIGLYYLWRLGVI